MSYTVTFFSGTDTNGREAIWETDGTAAGTVEVAPLYGISNKPQGEFTQVGNKVLFVGEGSNGLTDLFVTDGTTGGTAQLAVAGASSSLSLSPADLASLGTKVLFNGIDTSGNYGLWVSDGTAAGTTEIAGTSGIDPRGMTAFNGKVLFGAINGGGLWSSDGTAKGTVEFAGTATLDPEEITVFNGKAYFIDGKTGNLDVTDGTTVKAVLGLGQVVDLTTVGTSLFFEAQDTNGHFDLFKTDGTVAGTTEVAGTTGIFDTLVSDSRDGDPVSPDITVLNGKAYFEAADPNGGFGLWVSDGSAAGTHEITGIAGTLAAGIFPGTGDPDFNGPDFAVINNQLVFDGASPGGAAPSFGQTDLWVSNGLAAGTHELTGIPGGGYSGTLGLDASNMATITLAAKPTVTGVLFASIPNEVSNGFINMNGSVAAVVTSVKIYNGTTLLGTATTNYGSFNFGAQFAPGTYSNLLAIATTSTGQTVTQKAPYSIVTGITGRAYTDIVNALDASGTLIGQTFFAQGNVYLIDTVTKLSNGNFDYHYAGGSFFQGQVESAFDDIVSPAGVLLSQTLLDANGKVIAGESFNADGTPLLEYTVSTLANGTIDYHYAGGSFFTGKAYTAFDNVTSAAGVLLTQTFLNASGKVTASTTFNPNGTVYLSYTVTTLANGTIDYHYAGGSFFTGKSYAAFDNVTTASGTLLSQTLLNAGGSPIQQTQFNANGSIYLQDTVTTLSNGNLDYHFQGGTFFTGKSFAAFDNITNASNLLLSQTLLNASGQAIQQTQFNANGSIYLQDNVVYPAANQVLYQYRSGSFFTGKSFSAFDNLYTTGNTLLDQLLYNRDGSHSWTAPGSGLTLTAAKNDTFNVTGGTETTRFNATGFKADTFSGYKAGDIFSFAPSVFANFAAVQQHATGATNAVITDASGDSLTINGVAASNLTAGMFKFA